MRELVSVIVPVYNVEEYVDECIYSIVSQSYSDLEILIVDDGSMDSSGKICDKWGERDSRIKVIHQQNQGLSGARNAAIDICTGEWITFVDSDDVIGQDYVKILLELAKKYKVKISQCLSEKIQYIGVEETDTEETVIGSVQFLLSDKYQTMAWGKIYKKELFETIRYPYGKIHEDVAVTYRLVYETGYVAYTTRKLYFNHPPRPNSINASGRFYREKLVILQFLKEQIEFYKEKQEEELTQKGYRDYAYALLENYNKTKNILGDKITALKIKGEYQKICIQIIREDETISLKTKILLTMCFVAPGLWKVIVKE